MVHFNGKLFGCRPCNGSFDQSKNIEKRTEDPQMGLLYEKKFETTVSINLSEALND